MVTKKTLAQAQAESIDSLQVSELFYSIQGESTRQGLPCLFIRLAGCNLHCHYCDARYACDEPGTRESLTSILAWVERLPESMVEITGGEPLLQPGVYPLMQALVTRGRRVLLETNGSQPLDQVPETVHIIVDVKCPDSGMAPYNLADNLGILAARQRQGATDELKFVLSSSADFHWARAWMEVHRQQCPELAALPVLFSPVQPLWSARELAELLLAHRLPVRLQLQLHSLLWPGQTRGV